MTSFIARRVIQRLKTGPAPRLCQGTNGHAHPLLSTRLGRKPPAISLGGVRGNGDEAGKQEAMRGLPEYRQPLVEVGVQRRTSPSSTRGLYMISCAFTRSNRAVYGRESPDTLTRAVHRRSITGHFCRKTRYRKQRKNSRGGALRHCVAGWRMRWERNARR